MTTTADVAVTADTGFARVRPHDLSSLDEFVYEGVASYDEPLDEGRRLEWLAAAAEHHLQGSTVFARLATHRGFTPEQLLERGDPSLVPLLSSGLFKRRDLTTGSGAAVKLCKSTGTRGTQSIVPRDQRTLERFVGTVVHAMREFIGSTDALEAFVLSPSGEDADDIWFSYVLSLVELLYDTSFFVRDGALQPEALWRALAELDPEVQPAVVAPPGLLLDFLAWMEERGERLDLGARDGYVVTAGGWKRREDEAVSRSELSELVEERLGIQRSRIRDAYNMVELNTLLLECEHGRKHIPPWLVVLARRPADMSVADPGEEGVLSFLDPTAVSYPCFVLSDDLGEVHRGPCECGRDGETLLVSRRLDSVEQRGCGLKLERYSRESAT